MTCDPSFDDIAHDFDHLFKDVNHLTELEGQAMDAILGRRGLKTVLDCACGSGIQALGMVRRGYRVWASDISARMVRITRRKAAALGFKITAKSADFLNLQPWEGMHFDAVVSLGNSITLVKERSLVSTALETMLRHIRPGGVGVVGVHNYYVTQSQKRYFEPRTFPTTPQGKELIFDMRVFSEERAIITHFFLRQGADGWKMKTYTKSYLLLAPAEMGERMKSAGFVQVEFLDITGERVYDGGDWYLAVGETRG